ncbi:MAG: N-acetyl-gamma-glutamyl-phosphate reductase [Mangrovibacterium sp.]
MIQTGIIGGAGYTAGELIRILLYHPQARISFVQSSSNAGNQVCRVHRDLLGETGLVFTKEPDYNCCDVLFLCMGHGRSKAYLESRRVPERVKIIDLSQDFRIRGTHDFIYGLPELNREQIRQAWHLANPGCFATGIQLALLPLAAAGKLCNEVHVHAITGSTGAGQAPSATSHFSWRSGNISVYKAFEHQHLDEITQSIKQLQTSFAWPINFIPVRGNHTRGILVSAYTDWSGTLEEAGALYQKYYAPHPFVQLTAENPDLKQVVNTNKAVLHLEKHGDKLMILSVTDNLLKGASGQAVQNMNLMFGLNEKTGLNLKPLAF